MKKLLIALAMLPTIALAQQPTFRMGNKSGGEIVLTTQKCTHKEGQSLKHGYAYAKGGQVIRMCWYVGEDRMVHVIYLDDFTSYVYPIENFREVK